MLETRNLRKEYPGTLALEDCSIRFEAGSVHALIGKNGAGKSTLVKMLAGATEPTSGRILVRGEEVRLASPLDAFNKGIATVHQEMSLVPQMTVAENILLGRLPRRGLAIDWPEARKRARDVLAGMQVDLDVEARVAELGVAQQQVVEIAKAMSFEPSAVLFDEPTSALAHHETASLFKLIRELAARGVAIVYITHRLQELQEIADTVSVLRDGRQIGTARMRDTTAESIVHMMFGEIPQRHRPADLRAGEREILAVRGLTQTPHFSGVDLTLREGEILGIAGMLGSGRTELLRAIFGAEPFDSGEIAVGGEVVRDVTPIRMKRLGLALTPENRKEEGLVQILSTRANLCLASLDRLAPFGLATRGRERRAVERLTEQMRIKVHDAEEPVASLSGGNQQKVVVGKWLNTEPRIILFDEPTRGIDVQAKQQIFEIMWELSRRGIGSIFVSSELEELIDVCHRILVMKKGRIVAEVDPERLTADQLFVRCMED